MSDFTAGLPAHFEPEGLLQTVLDISLSPLLLLRPQYEPTEAAAEAADFALEYLNPAGQRLLALPAHPGGTLRSRFPNAVVPALLDFCRRQLGPAPAPEFVLSYPGPDQPLRVAGRRYGEHLVISLLRVSGAVEEESRVVDTEARASNRELLRTQQQLRQLNEQLETQAAERTRELRQARAEAEQQQQRLERFFSQAPAAICVLDGPELVFELVNPAYQQLFPGRQLLHRPLLEALPELAGQPVWKTLQQVYTTGETHEEIGTCIPIARAEGGPLENYYFHHIQQARYNEQGLIDGILVFAFDMTEQTQTQLQTQALQAEVLASTRRLAQERETFYQAFARAPAAICILRGPEHRLEYFNAAYEQLFPGRQMQARTLAEVQPEAVDQGFVALLDQVYQTGETYYGIEMPLLVHEPKDGTTRHSYFDFTYQAYQYDGQTAGISVFAYDVTQQVRARQQNEEQRQQLQQLFVQAPVAIAVFRGPQYVVELANPAMCALWGRTPEQALQKPLLEVLPEAAGQSFEELLDRVLTTGLPYVVHELPSFIDRNGHRDTVYWNSVYQPLREDDSRITGVVMVASEGTEQVLARQQVLKLNQQLQTTNEELQLTNQQLTHSNVDLDNFIYTASHDLKAPITNIEGLLHTLAAEMPAEQRPAEVSYILELMQDSVERFKKTIEQLTDVARLRQEQLPTATLVNVREVLLDVQLDLATLIHDTGARISRQLTDYASVVFSAKNLRSVLYNLLSNALKYHAPDRPPHIIISTRREGEFLVLEVRDNGLGLPENSRGRLFGMFQRFHSHVEGTGIGLYMVRKMVENAGGHLEVSSQEDVGSTFSVYFRQ